MIGTKKGTCGELSISIQIRRGVSILSPLSLSFFNTCIFAPTPTLALPFRGA